MIGSLLGIGILTALMPSLARGSDATTAATTPAAQEQTVTPTNLTFSPPSLSFQAGWPVHLTVINNGRQDHDLTIAGMHAGGVQNHTGRPAHAPGETVRNVPPVERAAIEFTPDHAGQFGVRCTIAGHMQSGRTGAVTMS